MIILEELVWWPEQCEDYDTSLAQVIDAQSFVNAEVPNLIPTCKKKLYKRLMRST
jgi:hypothetical protein